MRINKSKSASVCVLPMIILLSQSGSAELSYSPLLPQFGGSNFQALSVMQFEKGMVDSKRAKEEAARREVERELERVANRKTPADRLVESLTSVLQVRLSQGFVDQILTGSSVGDFNVGDIKIGYSRKDGLLSLTITDEAGVPTLIELPVN